jgi:hypothetical protein
MKMGSMTGRGAGYCNGFSAPGYANAAQFAGGFGGRFGCGFGRGFRRMFYANGMPGWARNGYPTDTGTNTAAFDEKAFLKGQAEMLENQLQQVRERLSGLDEEAE